MTQPSDGKAARGSTGGAHDHTYTSDVQSEDAPLLVASDVPAATAPASVSRNTIYGAGANTVRLAIGFAAGLVYTRALGPSGRGAFSFVTNAVALLVMLAGMGVPAALIHARAKRGRSPGELYAPATVVGLVAGLLADLVFAVLYLTAHAQLFRGIDGELLAWILLLVPLLVVVTHWTVIASMDDKVVRYAVANTISVAIFFIVVVVLAVLGALRTRVLISLWAIFGLLPIALVVRIDMLKRPANLLTECRRLLGFGTRANVASVVLVLAWRVDVFLVKGFRGLRELGLYVVAVGLAEIILQGATPLRVALTPLQGSPDRRSELVEKIAIATRLTVLAGGLFVVAAALLSGPIVRLLYGARFSASALAMACLLPGVLLLALQGPLLDYLTIEGRLKGVTLATSLAFALNVGIDVYFLREHTFIVAAVASTAAYGLSFLLATWLFVRATDVSLRSLLVARRDDGRFVRRKLQPVSRLIRRSAATR